MKLFLFQVIKKIILKENIFLPQNIKNNIFIKEILFVIAHITNSFVHLNLSQQFYTFQQFFNNLHLQVFFAAAFYHL